MGMRLPKDLEAKVLAQATPAKRTAPARSIIGGVASCGDCGLEFTTKSATHRYCEGCSQKRSDHRRADWAKRNPRPATKNRDNLAKRRSSIKAFGIEINRQSASGICWISNDPPPPVWSVRFVVPFSGLMSKNAIYSTFGPGHVVLRRQSRAVRDLIEAETRRIANEVAVVQAKTWIDLLVQKPSHRSDAINVIDLVCDGIKRGLGVDDRWFSIRRLDWELVFDNPQLVIGISQSSLESQQVCSNCGTVRPFSMFGKKKGTPTGLSRVCKSCRNRKPVAEDEDRLCDSEVQSA